MFIKITTSLIAGLAFACVGVAHAAPSAYSLSDDLKTTKQHTAAGDVPYSFDDASGYSFKVSLKGFPLHDLDLGSALPARCGEQTTQPCSIPLSKDSHNLFIVTGLKSDPSFGAYAHSALVVTNGAGSIVGIGQPMSSQDEDVSHVALGLALLLGDPTTANRNSAVFDDGDVALSANRTVGSNGDGTSFSLWLYEKDAFPVVSVPFVAGDAPIANFKRWSDEIVTVR